VRDAMKRFPSHMQTLISMKMGHYAPIDKDDIKFLKQFSDYMGCSVHTKLAEQKGISVQEMEKKIASGEIKPFKSFANSQNPNQMIHIIHKWQFYDLDSVHFTKKT
jgi:hypothetical protein